MTNTNTTRFEKVEWLFENCGETHMKEFFFNELIAWMFEEEFNEFYEHHTRLWSIETPEGDIDDR